MKNYKLLLYAATVSLLATACSDDDGPIGPTPGGDQYNGFYLLNRGDEGENNASLEYFNLSDYTMSEGWWALKNADVRDYLGDTGLDVLAHQDYVLVTLYNSNLLEISTREGDHYDAVDIPSCERIAAHGNFAYVSSSDEEGYVAKVDIEKGVVVGTCATGYLPQGLAIIGNKLYVLNKGDWGNSNSNKESSSISVIDLETFTETERVNIGAIYAAGDLTVMPDGHSLFVNSYKAGYDTKATSVIFDTATLSITKEFTQGSVYSAVYKGKLYAFDIFYSYSTESFAATGFVYDASTDAISDFPISLENLATIRPSGFWIHPSIGEVYIADGGNDKLLRFDLAGTLKGTYNTGLIPLRLAWDINYAFK